MLKRCTTALKYAILGFINLYKDMPMPQSPLTFEDKCKIKILGDESEVPSCDFALKEYPDDINQDIYPDDFQQCEEEL